MYKYKFLAIIYLCGILFVSFQQQKSDALKENNYFMQMAINLKLSDKQIFGLESINANNTAQINRIDLFKIDDATILQKLNSLNEKKINLFLGNQLYKQRIEFTKTNR